MNNFQHLLNILQEESCEQLAVKQQNQLLNEMIVYGDKVDDNYVVAFNKWIFLFNKKDAIDSFKVIIQKLQQVFPHNSFINELGLIYDKQYYEKNIEELLKELHDEVKDTLVGFLHDDKLYVYGFVSLDIIHSVICKKVLKQLNMSQYAIDITNFEHVKTISDDELKTFPNIGFHGTSSSRLSSIIRKGIQPGNLMNWSNIKNIDTSGLIFFSTNSIAPLFHSTHVSAIDVNSPIIIEFEIPDKNRVVPDYDVEMYTGIVQQYKRRHTYFKKAISNKPLSLSKELGIYAYKGTILPQKFKAIWITKEKKEYYTIDDFVRLKPKDAIKQLGVFII